MYCTHATGDPCTNDHSLHLPCTSHLGGVQVTVRGALILPSSPTLLAGSHLTLELGQAAGVPSSGVPHSRSLPMPSYEYSRRSASLGPAMTLVHMR